MTSDLGSTVPRRQLGRLLRELREGARITVAAAAAELEWSPQKIWRIESGLTAMRKFDVEAMCKVYDGPEEMTQVLTALAGETKAKGWWHSYGDVIPDWFELFVGLETAASEIRVYEAEVVPGLLQTEDYLHTVIAFSRPNMTEEGRAKRMSVRRERQAILTRRLPRPPRLDVILNEAVLRRPTRDRGVMARQLAHLADLSLRERITIRVLPFDAGPHRAFIAGAFMILDFPPTRSGRAEPPIVYSEGPTGALYLDKPGEVEVYGSIWRDIKDACLGPQESRALITKIGKEYGDD